MNKVLISVVALSLLGAENSSVDTGRMQRMAALLGAEPTLDKDFLANAERAEKAVNELVELALQKNPAVAAEKKTHAAREALVDASVANAYQPKLAAVGSAGESRNQDLDDDTSVKSRDTSYGLSLRQNLWRGGRDRMDIDLAETDERLAGLGETMKLEAVRFNVRRGALQFNYQEMQKLLATEAAKDATELKRLSVKKFTAGQVGKIDVHQATMRETDANASATKAALASDQAYFALLRSMGFSLEGDAKGKSAIQALSRASLPFPTTPPGLGADLPQTLAERNAVLAATKAELAASSAKRARYLPEVDLSASATRAADRSEGDLSTTDKSTRLNVGIELTWPLWERSQDHRITAAALDRDAATAKAEDAHTGAALAAEELRVKVKSLYGALQVYRDAYVEAGQLYEARLKLYEAGAIDIFVVTEADSQRLQSLRTWYDAVYEIRLALLKWRALEAGYVPES